MDNKVLLRVMIVVALIGMIDALYLTADYYFGVGIKCLVTSGCEQVLTSKYSSLWGIPVAVFGLLFYISVFLLANLEDIYQKKIYAEALMWMTSLGFVVSMALLYTQLFLIRALCFYCIISAISSTVLFILAIIKKVETNKLKFLIK